MKHLMLISVAITISITEAGAKNDFESLPPNIKALVTEWAQAYYVECRDPDDKISKAGCNRMGRIETKSTVWVGVLVQKT